MNQYIEEDIKEAKTHKNKDNTDDNGKPSKNHHKILLPKRMSQVQVTMIFIMMKNQDINMENQLMFLNNYIRIQKQRVKGHMAVL